MRRVGALLLGALMVLTPAAQALPTPGFFGEEAREATGRIFPEAMQTNDFVSYGEAVDGLKLLEEENPDLLTFHEIGESYGWDTATGGHETFDVFAVTVTNENSPVPSDEKINQLFMLSIHGNEKGGREGGIRVIEDFTKAWNDDTDTGMATPERVDMLDYTRLIFLFPNIDGWTHEEAQYRADAGGDAPFTPLNYVRGNGNGTDLNRQAPTVGWNSGEPGDVSHSSLREPEPRAFWPWLKNNFTDIDLASDIHGMLHPADSGILFSSSSEEIACLTGEQTPLPDTPGEVCLREGHFVLTMLPAAQMTPAEEEVTTQLAENIKQRLNSNPYFAEWQNAPEGGVWGGEYNAWGTVWDTIGYVDSGFSSDFFAQNHGLDAPGVDFELAYNHITFDNYYPGLAQRLNAYHIESVRDIVASFMDYGAQNLDVQIDTNGQRTAYVPTDAEITSEDNGELTGWAAQNPADDAYDWANGPGYDVSPNAYFEDRGAFLVHNGSKASIDELAPSQLDQLGTYDNLVIAGSAAERLLDDEAALDAVRSFVEDGGNLLLTDDALQLLAPMGVVDSDAVSEETAYAGHTNFVTRDHALADGVRGLARQLYEPMPLGFSIEANDGEGSSPVWVVDRGAFEDAGGETVGQLEEGQTNLGQVDVGDGTVTIVGALLPDASEEYYHPYGLADYATTYTGNQIVRNALGWSLDVDQTPREGLNDTTPLTADSTGSDEEIDPASADDANGVPGPGMLGVLAALGAALVLVRRRPSS